MHSVDSKPQRSLLFKEGHRNASVSSFRDVEKIHHATTSRCQLLVC